MSPLSRQAFLVFLLSLLLPLAFGDRFAEAADPLDTELVLEFVDTPLKDVCGFLGTVSGLKFKLAAGANGDTAVTARGKASLKKHLAAILTPLKLRYRVVDTTVHIEPLPRS